MTAAKQQIDVQRIVELAKESERFARCLAEFAEQLEARETKEIRISGWKKIISSLESAKESLTLIVGQASDLGSVNFERLLPDGDKVWRRPTKSDLKIAEAQVEFQRNQHKK